ncbi:hypothetical protein B0H67DRAFT_647167 [Lasiosphaeris hirsuta]|uniref:Uncharacterized protein n=1 Tax=Lasiosphaeris hirsuta TaxID=260670 RepID=A0AA40A9L9_9PEZI|nr:hypothetical protein B0H67DRAFT_647167 [Lasiosphaeris hirsuta]
MGSNQGVLLGTNVAMGDATYCSKQGSPTSKCLSILARDHMFANNGTVYCYEISKCTPDSKRYEIELLHHNMWTADLQDISFADQLGQFWKGERATDACHLRLVVVEDISGHLIDLLGHALGLDPLLFIQHLKGSGVNRDSLNPLVGSHCPDTFLGTHIVSAQWYRPVSGLIGEQKKKKGFSLLPDPWPTGDPGDGPGLRVRRLEGFRTREIDTEKETNIFRGAWEIGSACVPAVATDGQASTTTSIPTAWEEKVTVYRESRRGIEFVIVLTDPLPKLRVSGGAHTAARNISSNARGGTGFNPQISGPNSAQKKLKTSPELPYRYKASRWTYQRDGSRPQSASESQSYPDKPRTAHMDMLSWMTNQCLGGPESLIDNPCLLALTNPAEALFRIIFLDTMTLSDVFDDTLQQIRLASLEDSELQVSIGGWRLMLLQAQLRLPALDASISDFIHHASGWPLRPASDTGNFELPHDCRLLVSRARQRISAVIKRAEEVDVALRAELSILESRKQLLESSSVTRLTELAFVFVPLSFVASTFSMQVKELQSPPPLTTFILVASLTVFLAYVLRLFLNSRIFSRISRKTEQAARGYSQVPKGQPVPSGVYMNFVIWSVLLHSASVYGVVLVCLCSVVWLWAGRGQVDDGLKAVLTVVFVITLPLLAAVPFSNDTVSRGLDGDSQQQQQQQQQQLEQRPRSQPDSSSRGHAQEKPAYIV